MSQPFFDTLPRFSPLRPIAKLSRFQAIAKLSRDLAVLPLYLAPRVSYSVSFKLCVDERTGRFFLLQHFKPVGRFAISDRPFTAQVFLWLLLVQLHLYHHSLLNLSIALALRFLLCLLLLSLSGILSLLGLTLMAPLLGSGFVVLFLPPVAFVQGLAITLFCFKDV
jgi:hypothetical protein